MRAICEGIGKIIVVAGFSALLTIFTQEPKAISGNPGLEVRHSGNTILITNVGSEPVEILDIQINNRKECTLNLAEHDATQGRKKVTLYTVMGYMRHKAPDSIVGPQYNMESITIKWPYAIEAWGNGIEEHLTEEDEHLDWLYGTFKLAPNTNGRYHANYCSQPVSKKRTDWMLTNIQIREKCGYNGTKPEWEVPGFDSCMRSISRIRGMLPLVEYGTCSDSDYSVCNVCDSENFRRISVGHAPQKLVLQVGESLQRNMTCGGEVVRATIVTDRGSFQVTHE